MLLIPIEKFKNGRDSFRKAREAHLIHRTKGRTVRKLIGGVGRAKYKKIFAHGKIKWKEIIARQLILKNIHAMAENKFIQGIW